MHEKDIVTDLYGQKKFLSLLESKLEQAGEKPDIVLLFIEFDDLARFNDTFGMDIDEKLLQQIGLALQSVADTEDIVARVGTYRFVWVCEDVGCKAEAYDKAQSVLSLLHEPFCIGENMFYVTASIGICLASEECNRAAMMLKSAENTMRNAQKKGINHIAFASSEPNPFLKTELQLLKDLPSAIDNGEFYFVYQGQYACKNKQFTGAEILTRWKHPKLGNISPAVFIPLAEKSGMIGPLTTKLLIASSHMFSRLESFGMETFSLSVNISPYVLMEKSFCDTVSFLMESYGLAGKKLHFEIMEDTVAQNLENFSSLLQKIKKRGVGIEIDDYGTGHTSLKYLISLPIDMIKIDRSFVSDIDKNHKKYALLRAIVDMAKALEIDVIIEGVETEAENRKVEHFENVTVQGYFYAKPMEEEAFLSMVTQAKSAV
jgi:diguanylate cyclase (GGDEF)-like protein